MQDISSGDPLFFPTAKSEKQERALIKFSNMRDEKIVGGQAEKITFGCESERHRRRVQKRQRAGKQAQKT